MMKILKPVIAYLVIFFVVYMALMIIVSVVLYQNKGVIEKAAAGMLGVKKVEIADFFNLPLIMVDARKVRIENPGSLTVQIEHLRFYYNILKMPFVGLLGSVSRVSAEKADVTGLPLGDLKPFLVFTSGTNAAAGGLSHHLIFYADELTVRSGLESGLHAGVGFYRLNVRLNKNRLSVNTGMQLYAMASNQMEFFRSVLRADFSLDLSNRTGGGSLFVTNLDFGGVTLVRMEKIPFTVSNGVYPDIGHSVLSNFFSVTRDGNVHFLLERDFRLEFAPYREFAVLEYMLSPGDYRLRMSADFGKKRMNSGVEVSSASNRNKKWIQIGADGDRSGFKLNAWIKTPKYGEADVQLESRKENRFPSLNAHFNNFTLMDGLRIGGDLNVYSGGNTSRVYAESIRLNGGYFGSAFTILHFGDDGIDLSSPQGGFNENIDGWIRNGNFELNVRANGLPGSAAVSNIFFNFMGIGGCTVGGTMKVVSDGDGQFILTAGATGYRKARNGGIQKYVTTDLRFSSRDLLLSFPSITFPSSRMIFRADFSFSVFSRSSGAIDVGGSVNLFHRFDLPIDGRIDYDMLKSSVNAGFSIDDVLRVQADVVHDSLTVGITAEGYNLKRVGYDGMLDFDFHTVVEHDLIQSVRIRSQYAVLGRKFSFSFKSDREKEHLKIRQFMLDNRDDKLVATGFLWQSGGRLFGDVDFIRSGKISFSSTFDDIIGSLELHNWFFKDFLKEGRDVFITAKADFNGPLILPDINGSLKIVNSANSEKFSLEAPLIQKKGDEIVLRNALYRDPQSQVDLTVRLNSTEEGFIFSGDGGFNLLGTVRGKYVFSYFSQTNQNSMSYDISALNVGGKDLKNLSGGIIQKGSRYTFFKKGEYGLSGFYLSRKDYKEWNLDAIDQDLQGNFSGEIRNDHLQSDLVLQTQLYYLGFIDLLKDLSGEGKVSLKLQGKPSSPIANGSLRLYRANIGLNGADTRIRDLNINLGIENSKVLFNNCPVSTSSGNFLVKGFMDLKNAAIPYFELMFLPYDKKLPVFTLNYNTPSLKLSGDVTVSNLAVSGTPSALYLTGNVSADNALVMVSSLNTAAGENTIPPLVENIRWNLPVRIGNGVKFSNEFIDVILKKDDLMYITGDFANDSFALKGKVGVDRGTLTYLGRDFTVKEGTALFYGEAGKLDPYVNLSSTFRYRDEKNEYVDVYLTFEGKLSTIVVRDFYSSPSKSRSELSAVLGLKSDNIASGTNALLSSGVNVAENIWFFNPLGSDLRRRLGLDLFTIRTGFFENWARRAVAGDTNVNLASMWEGTSLVMGKYLLPNVFVQYEMTITRNPYANMELVPLHSVGVDFDLRYFDFGWKYEPISDLGKGVIYENKFEINFNRRF